MRPRSAFSLLVTSLPLVLPALAQDGPDPRELNPFQGEGAAAPRDRMIELFHEVERRMGAGTELLFDASKGDTSRLAQLGEAGLQDLMQEGQQAAARASLASVLEGSRGQGREVLRAIDEILELAQSQGGGS